MIVTVEPDISTDELSELICLPSVICEADESSMMTPYLHHLIRLIKSESALEARFSSDTMLWLSVVVLFIMSIRTACKYSPH